VIAELKPITVTGPFLRLGLDCIGPFPMTERGNRFIVVFICHFSKYVEAFATVDIKAQTIAELFVNNIVCRHGAPKILQFDLGSDFTSELMGEITKLCNTRKLHSTSYHPMSNGEVERMNNTLITRMRMYVEKDQLDWDFHVPFAKFAANIHVNQSTGFSAFELIFGRLPFLSLDSSLNFAAPFHLVDIFTYEQEVKKHFTLALTVIQSQIEKAQQKYKFQYDKKARNVAYKVGDLILKESQVVRKGLIRKLMPLYQGPYKIIKLIWPNIVVEMLDNPAIVETLHVNRTKPYKRDDSSPAALASIKVSKSHIDPNLDSSDGEFSNEDVCI